MTTPENMSNVDFVRLIDQSSDPATPATGYAAIYLKNGELHSINDAGLVVNSAQAAKVVQMVNTQTGAVATTTTVMPFDDTIPQNDEGGEFMTLAITPSSASNILYIDVSTVLSPSVNAGIVVALYQDSTANALAAVAASKPAGYLTTQLLRHKMTAGTTSATTFKVRCGINTAGTLTFNGQSSARLFGGVMASSITIIEVTP